MRKLLLCFSIVFLFATCYKIEGPNPIEPIIPPDSLVVVATTLTLSKDTLTFGRAGGLMQFDVETDGDWQMESKPDWVVANPEKGRFSTLSINVTVEIDPENKTRSGYITIVAGTFKKRLLIIQNKEYQLLTIDSRKPGSLEELLSQEDILTRYLKITGQIDYADLRYLTKVNNLLTLDLSEASIVEGERHTGVKWVTSPPNVIDIKAFDGFSSIESILLPANITAINDSSFHRCVNLNSVQIPSGVQEIRTGAFAHCHSLLSVTIPHSVTNLGKSAFDNCWYLGTIKLSQGMTAINEGTFANCQRMVNISIPTQIKRIESGAFRNCMALTTFNFGREGGYIGEEAFWGCSNLVTITIPSDGTNRVCGKRAFYNCTSLRTIYSPFNIPPQIAPAGNPEMCFDPEYLEVCVLYVPASAHALYIADPNWSSYNFKAVENISKIYQ